MTLTPRGAQRRRLLQSVAGVALGLGLSPRLRAADGDGQLLVLTSYPDALLTRFEAAFERAHPGVDVQFLWKTGREALPILRKQDQGGVDVYWSPALRNFPLLRDEGAFAPLTVDRAALPGRIGAQGLSDPQGRYEAFEIAGFGLVVNPPYLAAKGLPTPRRWADLADPRFNGHVILPVPSVVGFAPALIDVILQAEGWAAGWTLLQRVGAQAELSTRGPGVAETVAEGRRGVGPTIDFQALNAVADSKPVAMIYPERTGWSPAHIAITAKAPHPQAAAAFVAFALSDEGQKLLHHPDIRRHPARPSAYAAAPAAARNPFAAVGDFAYDPQGGASRDGAVAALFDLLITRSQVELREVLSAVEAASAAAHKLNKQPLIDQAEAALTLATAAPISDAQALTTPAPSPAQIAAWEEQTRRNRERALAQAKAVLSAARL